MTLNLLVVAGFAALAIFIGIFAWGIFTWDRQAADVFCPVRRLWVRALFHLDDDGRRADVLRCPLFDHRWITCGKPCLETAPR